MDTDAQLAKLREVVGAAVKAWDDLVSYEPCDECLKSGVALVTFDSDEAMDKAMKALRKELEN